MTDPAIVTICDLHNGPWAAVNCPRCTFKDGTPRPITAPAYFELYEFTHPGYTIPPMSAS